MTERWICKRCYTSADQAVGECPNCGLARGGDPPSPSAPSPELPDEESQARIEDSRPEAAAPIPNPLLPSTVERPSVQQPSIAVVPAPGATTSPPAVCVRCGTPLFAQWWQSSKGGYECRRCGALTVGAPPPDRSRRRSGCLLGCAGLFAVLAVVGLLTGDFNSGIGLMAFAGIIALVAVAATRTRAR
jgi:hypothetical protein